jgi:hypothetical protein
MLESLPVEKSSYSEYYAAPSSQPCCPKARAFYKSNPERLISEDSVYNELYRNSGIACHQAVQDWMAKHKDNLVGNWRCSECKSFWKLCTKPKHKHNSLVWAEPKIKLPGMEHSCKADLLFLIGENQLHLTEMKFLKESNIPKLKAKRSNYLQANLTAFIIQSATEFKVPTFSVWYGSTTNFKNEKEFEYRLDEELAKLQIYFMDPNTHPSIGICRTPDDQWCEFSDLCFKDGAQGKWLQQYPEWAQCIERLYWPKENLL